MLAMCICDRYVVAMAFSGNGQRLVAVTGDNRHSVHVFDWKRKELICPAEVGHNGQPPQVRDNEAVCWPCMHTRGWLPRSAAPGSAAAEAGALRP